MTFHELVEQVSGGVVTAAVVLAVLAFAARDRRELTDRRLAPVWVTAATAAWPLGIIAVVLAIGRVLVLA